MADFVPINTQEEFDSRIKERLEQARNGVRQQFADYETIKNDLAALKEESGKKDATISDLTNQLKGSRTELAKTKIALEKGLPVEMGARLTGETEEEIRKDAEALSALFKKQKTPAPLKESDPGNGDNKDAAMRELLNGLKNQ